MSPIFALFLTGLVALAFLVVVWRRRKKMPVLLRAILIIAAAVIVVGVARTLIMMAR